MRDKPMHDTAARLGRGAAIALVLLLAAGEGVAAAGGSHCHRVTGRFRSGPAPTCDSAVGFCTAGDLWGRLRGGYAFTMNTLVPAGDPTVPGVMFYTGRSHIDLDNGLSIVGTDTGTVDLDPDGTHAMAALLTFIDGATGHLVLRGTIDLDTGVVTGRYEGELCR